jgi:purine-binding chemotaxis protein CheW
MVTQVPLASPEIVGVVSFRGELMTVYSFAALLGITGWRTDPAVLVILEPEAGGRLAVDCEEAPRAGTITQSQFRLARERDSGPIIDVVGSDGKPTRLIVDIPAVVRRSRQK